MPRPTSADVARASGVSRATVSYVLNDTPGQKISPETRDRVRRAAERLGYAPSAAARLLRSGRSDLVLCVLPDWPLGPTIDEVVDRLAGALAEHDLTLLIYHDRGRRPIADLWKVVTPRAVIGLRPFGERDERAMRQAGIQVVATLLDEDPRRQGAITISQTRIGRLQVEHLAAVGHRRIGYAATDDPRVLDFARPRLDGARMACAELGLDQPLVEHVALAPEAGARAVQAWMSADPPVTAVAAYNDEVAFAVLAGAHAHSLGVPKDLAVIGVDDIPTARLAHPPLTTVSQSATAQAEYLAAQVLDGVGGQQRPQLAAADLLELVIRDSA